MVFRKLLILTSWLLLSHQRWAVCSSADVEDNQDSGPVMRVSKLGSPCSSHDDCRGQNSECVDSKCSCPSSHPVEVDNRHCFQTVPLNGTCIANSQCSYDGTAALCQAGVCVCRLGYKLHKANEMLTCIAT